MILLASLMLSGCVDYDVAVTFNSPNQGQIVQHIRLEERLSTLNEDAARQWLGSLERRARQLQGKVERLSNGEVAIVLPFSSGAELEAKFNEFFSSPKDPATGPSSELVLPTIDSHLRLHQTNLVFLQRDRFVYDLDLRSLGVGATGGNGWLNPGSLLNLEFQLQTPGGARPILPNKKARSTPGATLAPEVRQKGRQLVWKLQPGQVNHLEAVFWMTNPLGIGTAAIVLLVLVGVWLKPQRPVPSNPDSSAPDSSALPQA